MADKISVKGLNEYQDFARTTAQYLGKGALAGVNYTVVALVGEAGELANIWKKVLRRHAETVYTRHTELFFEMQESTERGVLIDELGDVLWYLAALASELGVTLEAVAGHNLNKLADRASKDKIKEHA